MKPRSAIWMVIGAEALVAAAGFFSNDAFIEGLQATTRWSGRLSLLIFSAIFILHPGKSVQLQRLLSTRFYLAFAVAHGIHLLELLGYVYLSGTQLVPYRLAGGFVAYTLIFAMPWIYEKHTSGALTEARFRTLGFVYLFYVWFIFFMTYVGRLSSGFRIHLQTGGGRFFSWVGFASFWL